MFGVKYELLSWHAVVVLLSANSMLIMRKMFNKCIFGKVYLRSNSSKNMMNSNIDKPVTGC